MVPTSLVLPSIERPIPGLPRWSSGKEPPCQCRRHQRCGFNPWVRKIPWRRAGQPTPVLSAGESPWTEEPDRLQSMGSQRRRKRRRQHTHRGRRHEFDPWSGMIPRTAELLRLRATAAELVLQGPGATT